MTAVVNVQTNPAPTPGQRISRTAGQGGGALIFVELWQAFGWFGADSWTAEEAAARWPALTAALLFVIAVVHNVVNWWKSERSRVPSAVTVSAEQGHVDNGVIVLLVLVAVVGFLVGRFAVGL